MARRPSFTSTLYRAARLSNTIGAAASGHPRRIATRAKNIAVGRALARAGVWRRLWR
jgi:muconolactone delta-isomerase